MYCTKCLYVSSEINDTGFIVSWILCYNPVLIYIKIKTHIAPTVLLPRPSQELETGSRGQHGRRGKTSLSRIAF